MNYQELQKEAKVLGIKYVGVSEKKLKKAVEAAKPKSPVETPKPEMNKKVNAAIVRNGGNEIRRYTVDIHGKNFAELAKEFAKDRDYEVELVEVKPGIVCPDCGNIINT